MRSRSAVCRDILLAAAATRGGVSMPMTDGCVTQADVFFRTLNCIVCGHQASLLLYSWVDLSVRRQPHVLLVLFAFYPLLGLLRGREIFLRRWSAQVLTCSSALMRSPSGWYQAAILHVRFLIFSAFSSQCHQQAAGCDMRLLCCSSSPFLVGVVVLCGVASVRRHFGLDKCLGQFGNSTASTGENWAGLALLEASIVSIVYLSTRPRVLGVRALGEAAHHGCKLTRTGQARCCRAYEELGLESSGSAVAADMASWL